MGWLGDPFFDTSGFEEDCAGSDFIPATLSYGPCASKAIEASKTLFCISRACPRSSSRGLRRGKRQKEHAVSPRYAMGAMGEWKSAMPNSAPHTLFADQCTPVSQCANTWLSDWRRIEHSVRNNPLLGESSRWFLYALECWSANHYLALRAHSDRSVS